MSHPRDQHQLVKSRGAWGMQEDCRPYLSGTNEDMYRSSTPKFGIHVINVNLAGSTVAFFLLTDVLNFSVGNTDSELTSVEDDIVSCFGCPVVWCSSTLKSPHVRPDA